MISEEAKLFKFVMMFEAGKTSRKALFSKRNINHSFAWITFLERIEKDASPAAKFHFLVSSQGEVSPWSWQWSCHYKLTSLSSVPSK